MQKSRQVAVGDEVLCPCAVAVVGSALISIDGVALDFARHCGEYDVPLEGNVGFHEGAGGGQVADVGAFHVVGPVSDNPVPVANGFVLIAVGGELAFLAGVGGVEVSVEHDGKTVSGTGQHADGVVSSLRYLLKAGFQAGLAVALLDVFGRFFLEPRRALYLHKLHGGPHDEIFINGIYNFLLKRIHSRFLQIPAERLQIHIPIMVLDIS